MKKTFLFIAIFSWSYFLSAQEQQLRINTAETTVNWSGSELFKFKKPSAKVSEINIAKSSIAWTGSQLFKFNKHSGTVKIKSGTILTREFKVVGGTFVIDMNTIVNTGGKYNEMLVNHLKSEDFFSVKTYPEAKLEIIKVIYNDGGNVEVYADLTIKNITNPIKFNAEIDGSNGNVKLESKFMIDRTRWGINYESKGILGSVKDDIISDAIEFQVVIEWVQDMC